MVGLGVGPILPLMHYGQNFDYVASRSKTVCHDIGQSLDFEVEHVGKILALLAETRLVFQHIQLLVKYVLKPQGNKRRSVDQKIHNDEYVFFRRVKPLNPMSSAHRYGVKFRSSIRP